MLDPKTETISKVSTPLVPDSVRNAVSVVLLTVAGVIATVCALLWIWKADARWGATGVVLFFALFFTSMAIVPKLPRADPYP